MTEQQQVPALEVRNLRHAFKEHVVLQNVEFTVEPKAIHGFVGPNGAGKTTTLKLIATLLKPQQGEVKVFGHDVTKDVREVRRRIGFMPDHFSMYRQMTVWEYLDFFAAAYGQNPGERDATIQGVLDLTDMTGRRDDLIRGLSRGMQQRVSLARVLVHDPDLLLLDEPASGLDPRARIELMEILRELARMGKTIFVSSHILSELATLCDSVTIIDRGSVRYCGPMADLLDGGESEQAFELQLATVVDGLDDRIRGIDGVESVESPDGEGRYVIGFDAEVVGPGALLKRIMDCHDEELPLVGFHRVRRHLNDAFMDLTSPGVRE